MDFLRNWKNSYKPFKLDKLQVKSPPKCIPVVTFFMPNGIPHKLIYALANVHPKDKDAFYANYESERRMLFCNLAENLDRWSVLNRSYYETLLQEHGWKSIERNNQIWLSCFMSGMEYFTFNTENIAEYKVIDDRITLDRDLSEYLYDPFDEYLAHDTLFHHKQARMHNAILTYYGYKAIVELEQILKDERTSNTNS